MGKVLVILVIVVIAVAVWLAWPHLRVRVPDDFQKLPGPERVARARAAREAMIRGKYRVAGVPYPGEIFVRWIKHEAVIELWARDTTQPFQLVASWPILSSSGGPGPKRREGCE